MKYNTETREVSKDFILDAADGGSAMDRIKSKLWLSKAVASFAAIVGLLSSNAAWAAGQTLVYTGSQNVVTEATAVAGSIVVLGIIGAGAGMIMGNSNVMKYGGYTVGGGGLALAGTAIRDYIFGGAAAGAVINAITAGSF